MLWSVVNEQYFLRNFPRTELSLNAVTLNSKKVYKMFHVFQTYSQNKMRQVRDLLAKVKDEVL